MLLLLSLNENRQRQLSCAGKCLIQILRVASFQKKTVKLSVKQMSYDAVGSLLVVADASARGA